MIRVLFVCLGNICRSPMAEAVFSHRVQAAGLGDQTGADSAGSGDWHAGETAHRGTLGILAQQGIPYDGRSRQIDRADLGRFDYVLAMDRSNLADIRRMTAPGPAEVKLFLHYAHTAGLVNVDEVPDPYYDGRYAHVYGLVDKGTTALLDHIRVRSGI